MSETVSEMFGCERKSDNNNNNNNTCVSLAVSILGSPAVDRSSNPGSGSALCSTL